MMSSIIEVRDLKTIFGTKVVHDGLNLTINEGELYGLMGPSGCGKTTLLHEMVMLQDYQGGSIDVLGNNLNSIKYDKAQQLRRDWENRQ